MPLSAPQPNELTCNKGDGASASSQEQNAHPSKASAGVDASTLTGEEEEEEEGKAPDNSPTASLANAPSFPEVPMLARLVKEAETAKFYAYCEEVSNSSYFSTSNNQRQPLPRLLIGTETTRRTEPTSGPHSLYVNSCVVSSVAH